MSSTKTIKQLNTDRVKEVIINSEYSTKNSLADATGLSVATCGNIIKELLSTGEIIEVELSESTGGRPSRQFIYNKDFQYIAVLYVRVERPELTMVYSIQTLSGEVIENEIITVDDINIDVIDSLMGELLQKYPNIKVLAFGVPGVVKNNRIDFCDVSNLNGLDVYNHFMDKFGIISIADNDVNMSALGYYNRHCMDESDSFAYIYYPTDCGPVQVLL